METINRSKAPDYKLIDKINISKPEILKINNNVPLFVLNSGTEDVVRLEIVFNAGSKYSESPLISSVTNAMLYEGTKTLSSKELSEKIDFFGAYVMLNADRDYAQATLYSLGKHFAKTLELFTDLINNPSFAEHELNILLENKVQKYKIDEQKVKTLSAKKFNEVVFGKKHYYGRNIQLSHFDLINSQQLNDFHTRLYNKNNCKVIISGKITDSVLKVLENNFIVDNSEKQNNKFTLQNLSTSKQKKHFVEKADAVQTSIRIGKPIVNKNHSDFIGLQILNTILGGYFGSRFMSNLREDNGYTYGVGSVVASLVDYGFFTTVCEVGADYTKLAINEIYKEIQRLIDEPVGFDELERVKNYMLGDFLRSFDGPFAQAEAFRSVNDFNLDEDYFIKYLNIVRTISPEELQQLAIKYLQPNSLYEIVAGKY